MLGKGVSKYRCWIKVFQSTGVKQVLGKGVS